MRLCLRILNAEGAEAQHVVNPPGGLLGRSTDCAVHLGYDSVSRQHAELRHDGKDWWVYSRSQTSPTMLDDELLPLGQQQKLGQRGVLKLGRVLLEYRQEPLPSAQRIPDPSAPLSGEATLVLPRMPALAVPQSVLAQMSPVRAAEPEPPSAPPTLVRRPQATPPTPPIAAQREPPPTLIRSNRPPVSAPPPLPPPLPFEAPATIIRRPPSPSVQPAATAVAQTVARAHEAAPPIVEHQPQPMAAVPEASLLIQARAEGDKLRSELVHLGSQLENLKRENAELQDAKAALIAQLAAAQAVRPPAPSSETPRDNIAFLREKALELLQPFSRGLEQAGEAMRQGDQDKARSLLRSVSFALADLRDLFQS